MKNKLLALLLPVLLIGGAVNFGGCANTPPSRTAITFVDAGLTTADTAVDAWYDYVVLEQARLDKIKVSDPAAYKSGTEILEAKRAEFLEAYLKYQTAARAVVQAGAASATPGDMATKLAAAAAPLIALVNILLPKT